MIRKKIFGLILILLLGAVTLIFAQDNSSITSEAGLSTQVSPVSDDNASVSEESLLISDPVSPDGTAVSTSLNTFSVWDFVRMILVLAGVLLLIYFIFFLLKRAGKPKIVSDSTINVISSQNLESGRSLHLVEIGPQVFLIGSGEGSVRLITEIENKETLDTIKLEKSINNQEPKTFTDIFRGFFKKENISLAEIKTEQKGFMRKQRDRLKNM